MFIINGLPTARQLIDYSYIDMKDSTFKFVIERYLPQDLMIKYGQLFSVFVHPGDSLFITIDGKKLNENDFKYDMFKFSGEPAEFNKLLQKYLAEDFKENKRDFKKFFRFQKMCTAKEMKHYADSIRKIKLDYLAEFDSLYHPYKELLQYLHTYIYSSYIYDISFYPFYHTKFNDLNRDDVVPSSYYNYFDEVKLTKENLICTSINSIVNSYGADYIGQHLKEKLQKEGKVRDTIIRNKPRIFYDVDYLTASLRYIPEITKDTLLMQLALCEAYGQRLEGMNYRFFEKNKDIFDKYVTRPYLRVYDKLHNAMLITKTI